jgi:acyl carrier protein
VSSEDRDCIEIARTVAAELNLLNEGGELVRLDSLSIADFVTELERSAGIEIPASALEAEAFRSLETIAALLQRLRA